MDEKDKKNLEEKTEAEELKEGIKEDLQELTKNKSGGKMKKIFITGFLAMLPLVITIYIIKILYGLIVRNLMPFFNKLAAAYKIDIPDSLMGVLTVILFVLLVFGVGILTRMYIGKILIGLLEKAVTNIPVVNTIYTAIKQMIDSFGSSSNNFEKVVLVDFPRAGIKCVGYVVRTSQPLFLSAIGEECYNVFVPTAPNPTSGFVTIVPVKDCIELPVSVEDGVKFVFSVGVINLPSLSQKMPEKP